jgi:hypothetical protein
MFSYLSAVCLNMLEFISSVKSSRQLSQILYCLNFISVFRRGMKRRKQMQAIRAWRRKWKDLSCVGWQLQGQEEGELKTDVKNLAKEKPVLWLRDKTQIYSLKYSAYVSCRLSSGFQYAPTLLFSKCLNVVSSFYQSVAIIEVHRMYTSHSGGLWIDSRPFVVIFIVFFSTSKTILGYFLKIRLFCVTFNPYKFIIHDYHTGSITI